MLFLHRQSPSRGGNCLNVQSHLMEMLYPGSSNDLGYCQNYHTASMTTIDHVVRNWAAEESESVRRIKLQDEKRQSSRKDGLAYRILQIGRVRRII
jgi:hypothetical protein